MIGSPRVGERVMVVSNKIGSMTLHRGGAVVGRFDISKCDTGTIYKVIRQRAGRLCFVDVEVDPPNFGVFAFDVKELKRLK